MDDEGWKEVLVRLLAKVPLPEVFKHLRTIALLNASAKIWPRLMFTRFQPFDEDHDLCAMGSKRGYSVSELVLCFRLLRDRTLELGRGGGGVQGSTARPRFRLRQCRPLVAPQRHGIARRSPSRGLVVYPRDMSQHSPSFARTMVCRRDTPKAWTQAGVHLLPNAFPLVCPGCPTAAVGFVEAAWHGYSHKRGRVGHTPCMGRRGSWLSQRTSWPQ